ncbi:MAG TPA: bifunctional riboflavin kinase/FAD synthetase [Bacteroidales bacterium]|nr:bifunctional riboflavin kinase/FAD synthetase [Bacteroidales bacterium]
MQIFYGIENYKKLTNPVVTIGTFDGVHIGHKKVLYTLNSTANSIKGNGIVITFFEHPRIVLNKDVKNLKLLNTLNEKIALLENSGLKNLLILHFNKELAALSANNFIKAYIKDIIGSNLMIIGYDHHIGKNRASDTNDIKNAASSYNIDIITVPPATINDNITVSSTIIRNALHNGDIKLVNKCLGYNYFFSGKVVAGNKLGQRIGFPTANILPNDELKLIPAIGVYAVKVKINNTLYKGMMNIGSRPTINNNLNTTIEINIFDFNQYIYNELIEIYIVDKIRNEIKFDNLESLQKRLFIDKKLAIQILNS